MGGFTLLEMLVVLTILAILTSIAAPSMRDLIASSRVKSGASDLFASLIFARSEAVKRNANVDVIPSVATNWGAGWSVRLTGGTDDLALQQPIASDVIMSGPASSIRYRGDGRLIDPSTGSLFASEVPFTFLATNYSHLPMRCIDIDPSGRPSVRVDTDHDSSNGCN